MLLKLECASESPGEPGKTQRLSSNPRNSDSEDLERAQNAFLTSSWVILMLQIWVWSISFLGVWILWLVVCFHPNYSLLLPTCWGRWFQPVTSRMMRCCSKKFNSNMWAKAGKVMYTFICFSEVQKCTKRLCLNPMLSSRCEAWRKYYSYLGNNASFLQISVPSFLFSFFFSFLPPFYFSFFPSPFIPFYHPCFFSSFLLESLNQKKVKQTK